MPVRLSSQQQPGLCLKLWILKRWDHKFRCLKHAFSCTLIELYMAFHCFLVLERLIVILYISYVILTYQLDCLGSFIYIRLIWNGTLLFSSSVGNKAGRSQGCNLDTVKDNAGIQLAATNIQQVKHPVNKKLLSYTRLLWNKMCNFELGGHSMIPLFAFVCLLPFF